MKRSLTIAVLVAAIVLIPPQARTDPPPVPKCMPLVRCVTVVLITVAGGVITYYVKQWCDRTFSNRNWWLTNEDALVSMPSLYSRAVGPGTTTVQSATGMGSAWVDGYAFNLQQVNGTQIVAVASLNGVSMATNSAPIDYDGQTVVLDFRKLLPASTNASPSLMLRLMN